MDNEDVEMEDVTLPSTNHSTIPSIPEPPLPTEVDRDEDGIGIIRAVWALPTKPTDVASFLARWPPSRTPITYAHWISVSRKGSVEKKTRNIEGLMQDWEILKQHATEFQAQMRGTGNPVGDEKHQHQPRAINPIVTPERLHELAVAHGVVSGKWLVYMKPHQVDEIWSRIVTAVVVNAPPAVNASAKVSPAKPGEPHVICVYVEDYSDTAEVERVRGILRKAGVTWKIKFKTDAYTYFGIYKENEWNIRPSIYYA